jgi:hypothetical protein
MEDSSYLELNHKGYRIPDGHYQITKKYFEDNGQMNPSDKEIREFYFLHMYDQICIELIFKALERKRNK